jgi:hypothetical protein
LKNNNIEYIIPFELFTNNDYLELPTSYSSSANTGYQENLDQSQGSNNPGISDSSSGSGQPNNSGSNDNNGSPDPINNFDAHRRQVGAKLRELYVNRPPRSTFYMTHPNYADKIDA